MTNLPPQIPDIDGVDPELIRILNQRLASIARSISGTSDTATTALNTVDIQIGPHGLRKLSTAAAYAETDRNALYVLAPLPLSSAKQYTLVNALMLGTTAQKPADLGQFDKGFAFFDSSMKILSQWSGSLWVIITATGIVGGTLSQMITLGATLHAADAGVKFRTTDYFHTHVWTGSAWDFAPEDDGSHYFRLESAAPNMGKWQKCDGSTVNWCGPTGALTAITLPNAAAGDVWPVFGSAYTGSVVTEVQGTLVNATDSGGAHTHTATVSGGTTGGPSATTVVQSGTGATVASGTHTHADGTQSGPTDSQGSHTHTLSLVRTTASRPPKLVFLPYFRQ